MTLGDACITLHHLMGDQQIQETIKFVAVEEVRKCVEDVRRNVRDGKPELAALNEAQAQVWERLSAVLRGYADKYRPE